MNYSLITEASEKLLFTPGPLTTKKCVKEAALFDLGSRDTAFIEAVSEIRKKLLKLGHVEDPSYETVIMQGSGTFGIESVISSAVPADGMLLNIVNGAYGRRISQMALIHRIPLTEYICAENELPSVFEVEDILIRNPQITHIAIVHGETTTGLLNPIGSVGVLARKYSKAYIVDAMSTFGAYDIDISNLGISFLISSSNKCIEGIPGFSYVIAEAGELAKCKANTRTLSLDLYSQFEGLSRDGQFRFTPPVQVLLSFLKAMVNLEKEGGVRARGSRYKANNDLLVKEMCELGFRLYLEEPLRSFVITSFLYPDHPAFSFKGFYNRLNEKGFVIYPGKLTSADCFRIGNIGHLNLVDVQALIDAIEEVLMEMNIDLK